MNTALLVIDIQEATVGHRRGTAAYEEALWTLNATADIFRAAGKPVVVIRDLSEGDSPTVSDFKGAESDLEVLKSYNNAFWRTDLEALLKARGIDTLILCGSAAEYCVLATYNGAVERDFNAYYLQKGVLAEREAGLLDIFYNRPVVHFNFLNQLL